MGRTLIIIGVLFILLGVFWQFGRKLGLGSLPGDFKIEREHMTIYLPLTTSILLSGILSALLWLFRRF